MDEKLFTAKFCSSPFLLFSRSEFYTFVAYPPSLIEFSGFYQCFYDFVFYHKKWILRKTAIYYDDFKWNMQSELPPWCFQTKIWQRRAELLTVCLMIFIFCFKMLRILVENAKKVICPILEEQHNYDIGMRAIKIEDWLVDYIWKLTMKQLFKTNYIV